MDARLAVLAGVVAATLLGSAVPAAGNESGPANDSFAAAVTVAEAPFAETVDTAFAGLEIGEPQPSCNPTSKTVWYGVTPTEDITLVAEASGSFRSVLTVFQGTYFGDLAELACEGDTVHPATEFDAIAGQTYFIQIGSARRAGGVVDFHLTPSNWQQKTLHRIQVPVEVPEVSARVLTVDGRPRPNDPAMYDVSVTASDQQPIGRGVLTFGLVSQAVHLELLHLAKRTVDVTLSVGYRYDATQYRCLTDGGEGQACTLKSPIKDLSWLTSGEGSRAELIVRIKVVHDGQILTERTIAIPYAGQVPGIV